MGENKFTSSFRQGVLVLMIAAMLVFPPIGRGAAGSDPNGPRRIVSLNVCTDQLLMMMVPRTRIAAVSYLAANSQTSVMADTARGLPFTYGNAEHVILLKPDLVLAGTYTTRATVHLLRKLGVNLVELAPASNFDQIVNNIQLVGAAVGESKRAGEMIKGLQAELRNLQTGMRRGQPMAALVYENSYSSGKGTLIDSILSRAGFTSLGSKIGITGTRKLSLETLLTNEPNALVLGHKSFPGDALSYEVFRHPALRHLTNKVPSFSLANALTVCGTPHAVKAVKQLKQFQSRHKELSGGWR